MWALSERTVSISVLSLFFQFIAGHPPFVILDAFLYSLYRFTDLMWWRRFPELSDRLMSAGEMNDA